MAAEPASDLQAAYDAAAEGDEVQVLDGLPLLEEAGGHKEKGNACVKQKQFLYAVGHYEEGLKTLARSDGQPLLADERQRIVALKATLHSNIAQCQLSLKLYRRAVDAATECLKLDGAHAKALHRRSAAHEALREYEEALRDALELRKLGDGSGVDMEALQARCDGLFERQAKMNQAVNKAVGDHERMVKMKERFEAAFKKHGLYEADAAPEIARWLVAHDDLPFTVEKIAEKWRMSKGEAEDIAKWISKGLELGIVPRPDVVKEQ